MWYTIKHHNEKKKMKDLRGNEMSNKLHYIKHIDNNTY